MLHMASRVSLQQRLSIDFITLKHACPKSVYVAPIPEEPLQWHGVIFVRKGPYSNAILRFQIAFPPAYPARPPSVTFSSDVFHPLIAPLTTYTYSTRDRNPETTISASDSEKLPPGGLTLQHGFPEWYGEVPSGITITSTDDDGEVFKATDPGAIASASKGMADDWPHVIEVLQYMRIILDTESVIDTVPLTMAANPGAWHAWRSHRAKGEAQRSSLAAPEGANRDRSMSPNKAQPGGARRPGEWNWTGVWEDRVRKAVNASISESTLYGGDAAAEIEFSKLDDNDYARLAPEEAAHADAA